MTILYLRTFIFHCTAILELPHAIRVCQQQQMKFKQTFHSACRGLVVVSYHFQYLKNRKYYLFACHTKVTFIFWQCFPPPRAALSLAECQFWNEISFCCFATVSIAGTGRFASSSTNSTHTENLSENSGREKFHFDWLIGTFDWKKSHWMFHVLESSALVVVQKW